MDDAVVDRLREHGEHRLVAIPDTDGEVQAAFRRLDELLALVAAWEDEDPTMAPAPASWPWARAGRRSRASLRRYEGRRRGHPPNRWLLTGATSWCPWRGRASSGPTWCSWAWPPGHSGRRGHCATTSSADALTEMAGTDGRKPEDLVAEAARLQGLLSLAWEGNVSQLARALPAHGGRVVLTPALHGAYQRLVDRILGIWHAGDPLAPLLYRGDR